MSDETLPEAYQVLDKEVDYYEKKEPLTTDQARMELRLAARGYLDKFNIREEVDTLLTHGESSTLSKLNKPFKNETGLANFGTGSLASNLAINVRDLNANVFTGDIPEKDGSKESATLPILRYISLPGIIIELKWFVKQRGNNLYTVSFSYDGGKTFELKEKELTASEVLFYLSDRTMNNEKLGWHRISEEEKQETTLKQIEALAAPNNLVIVGERYKSLLNHPEPVFAKVLRISAGIVYIEGEGWSAGLAIDQFNEMYELCPA